MQVLRFKFLKFRILEEEKNAIPPMFFTYQIICSSFYDYLLQGMKHESNDVKQLIGQLVSHFTSSIDKPLDPSVAKLLIPSLVMGTKERNTLVKSNSEFALISLLQLRKDESYLKVNPQV